MRPRIAFHAPLKPPDHPVPSGDREFARLLIKAARRAGFDVVPVPGLRTRNGDGDGARQTALETRAAICRERLADRLARAPIDLWMTYHVYYKAPDLLGPALARRFEIPYVVVEGSHAPSRLRGPWARGAALAEAALRMADRILVPNPKDRPALEDLRGDGVVDFPPFLDVDRLDRAQEPLDRAEWADRLSLDRDRPWMLAVGMFRPGDKTRSFAVLADALDRLATREHPLVIVGDGATRREVEAMFAGRGDVRFAGRLDRARLTSLTAACDLFVWPAVGEAFGLAPLEAQALGLPCVLGDRPGTRAIARPGKTALLAPEGDAAGFAAAVDTLLGDPARRREMGAAARRHALARHDLPRAAALLRETLSPLLTEARRR
jgi:glycosyltransferase involved in cell wall biosynthesis